MSQTFTEEELAMIDLAGIPYICNEDTHLYHPSGDKLYITPCGFTVFVANHTPIVKAFFGNDFANALKFFEMSGDV